jgi:hypothetical protein
MLPSGPIMVRWRKYCWFICSLQWPLVVWLAITLGLLPFLSILNCFSTDISWIMSRGDFCHQNLLCPWTWQVVSAEELMSPRSRPQPMTDEGQTKVLPCLGSNFKACKYQNSRVGLNSSSPPFHLTWHHTLRLFTFLSCLSLPSFAISMSWDHFPNILAFAAFSQ